jgi:hypothetical protein
LADCVENEASLANTLAFDAVRVLPASFARIHLARVILADEAACALATFKVDAANDRVAATERQSTAFSLRRADWVIHALVDDPYNVAGLIGAA